MRHPAILAAGALLTLSACSSGAAATSPPGSPPATAGPVASATATGPADPFKVKQTACNGISVTVLVTNTSRTPYTAQVEARFVRGGLVEATSTQTTDGPLGAGEREYVTVQNVSDSGRQGSRTARCELVEVAALSQGSVTGQWLLGQ